MGFLRAFCGPWVNYGACGVLVMFLALAGTVMLGIGGGMLAVHKPHTMVPIEAELFSVQNDYFEHAVMPETHSWCLYSLRSTCPDSQVVNVTARRNNLAYNGLDKVSPQRCFADVSKLNDAGVHGVWNASCVAASGVVCTEPRPIVRAWYQQGKCASGGQSTWTLNDPAETLPRFLAICITGGIATLWGLGPMAALWVFRGCKMKEDLADDKFPRCAGDMSFSRS